MEGVTLEEFVGWFFSSGTFVVVILAAVAWKAAQSAWENNRRMKASAEQMRAKKP